MLDAGISDSAVLLYDCGSAVRVWVNARRGKVSTTRIRDEASQRGGQLGPAALDLMRDVFSSLIAKFATIRARESVDDLVQGFFVAKGKSYVTAVLAASDDAAARRITYAWATNWLVDEARKLPFGALRNRIEKRLERSDLFSPSSAAHHWYLTGGEDEGRSVPVSDLEAAAAATQVAVRTEPSGKVVLGAPGELEELLHRLLDLAGRLHVAEITVICGNRFPLALQQRDASLSVVNTEWEVIEDTRESDVSVFETATRIRSDRIAAGIVPMLTEKEKAVICHRGDMDRLAEVLACSRSSAYTAAARLRERLQELAGAEPNSREIMTAVVELVLDEAGAVPSLHSDREDERAN